MEVFADAIGASKGMVSKWERWLTRPNERYMQLIHNVTKGSICPNDFYRIVSPVSSSAGEAGASLPPHDAPAIFQQGREEVSRRVHIPEIAGSTPAPATSLQSPDVLPTGEARVSFSHFDTPATISAEGKR